MKLLTGKVAIITGASAGIGRAAALLFAQHGASVVVGARRADRLDALVAEIEGSGGRASAVAGDVSEEVFSKALTEMALDQFGGLDVAFNNAGVLGAVGATPDITVAAWREAMDINLTSAFMAAKHQVPAMLQRGGGSIVFTSSFVGHTAAFPGMASYAASKAGLVGLTKALAVEFGRQGVRVNALLPGATDTDMGRGFASTPDAVDYVCNLNALNRMATPQEIARSALFLASGESGFMSGAAMLVDGGVSVYRH